MLTKLYPYVILLGGFLFAAMHPTKTHPVAGEWATDGNKSKITIAPCGDKFCGTITWLKDPGTVAKNAGVGTRIIKDFKVVDSNTMENGKILDPRSDKWYSGRLKVGNDGRLEVRGWLGMPALGKSVYWTRAK
jgi:uncharacterized protein (DUF2147 family)